jgi:4-aminobutyrate aminotransferase-like enzyme
VLMPLVITERELEQGLAVMEKGLEHVESMG